MKNKLLHSMILSAGFMLTSILVSQAYGQTPQQEPAKGQTVQYTCPMHPDVVRDLPGKCPKCGMTLVEKKDMPKKDMHQKKDSTMMKQDKMTMKHDSTMMKKHNLMHDSTAIMHDPMGK